MRYAKEVAVGPETRLTEVVTIPTAEEATPLTFLSRMFGSVTDFVHVSDVNINGAVKQSDGTYLNPAIPSPPSQPIGPVVFDAAGFSTFVCGLLDPDPLVGRSKLRQILEAAAAKTGALPSDLRTRDFKDWFYATRSFDKATVSSYLADLVTSAIITTNQKNAVVNGWPNG